MQLSDIEARQQPVTIGRVLEGLTSRMRNTPPHGISGHENTTSELDELGCLLSTGNILADVAAGLLKRRIAKALTASHLLCSVDLEEAVDRAYRKVASLAVDDWEKRTNASLDQVNKENYRSEQKNDAEAGSRAEDIAFLQSMIAGSIHLLDTSLADKVEPIFLKYENDFDVMALCNQAANAYADAGVAAAKIALCIKP